jgi:hypothetical protein
MGNPHVEIQKTGDRTLAVINGKTYRLLRAYKEPRPDEGWMFLAVAGKTSLKPDDLAEHWAVVRKGNIYLAFSQRYFAYYLLGPAQPPVGWPKFQTPPAWYCFVGLTEEAATHLLRLTLREYRPDLDPDRVTTRLCSDECGGPAAILLKGA